MSEKIHYDDTDDESYLMSKEEARLIHENSVRLSDLNREKRRYDNQIEFVIKGAKMEGCVGLDMGINVRGESSNIFLIAQSFDGVAVLHLCPELIQKDHVYSHLSFALEKFLSHRKGPERTRTDVELSTSDIAKLQEMIDSGEIRFTIIAGEKKFVPSLADDLREDGSKYQLPKINAETYFVGKLGGEEGYNIYVSPEKIYCIDSAGRIIKYGDNFPPQFDSGEDEVDLVDGLEK